MKGYSEFHGQMFRLSFDPSTGRFAEVPAGFAFDEKTNVKRVRRVTAKAASDPIRKSVRIVAGNGPIYPGKSRQLV